MSERTDRIVEQMAAVRRSLNSDVADAVESAQELLDWKAYARQHPWLLAGGAGILGFLLVPSRPVVVKADPASLAEVFQLKDVVRPPRPRTSIVKQVVASAVTMGTGALIRSGATFATSFLTNILADLSQPSHGTTGTASPTRATSHSQSDGDFR